MTEKLTQSVLWDACIQTSGHIIEWEIKPQKPKSKKKHRKKLYKQQPLWNDV